MSIVVTHLTSDASPTNASSYATASVEMPVDVPIYIFVGTKDPTIADPNTVSSTSVTFTKLQAGETQEEQPRAGSRFGVRFPPQQ